MKISLSNIPMTELIDMVGIKRLCAGVEKENNADSVADFCPLEERGPINSSSVSLAMADSGRPSELAEVPRVTDCSCMTSGKHRCIIGHEIASISCDKVKVGGIWFCIFSFQSGAPIAALVLCSWQIWLC